MGRRLGGDRGWGEWVEVGLGWGEWVGVGLGWGERVCCLETGEGIGGWIVGGERRGLEEEAWGGRSSIKKNLQK